MFRRRRLPERLEERRRAFEDLVPELERAKAALTESVPGTRLPGRPLAETLLEFEDGLAGVRAGMARWRAPELEDAWRRAQAGLERALALAERVRVDAPEPRGFEELIALVGELIAPLDAFAGVEERFRRLRARPQGPPDPWPEPNVVDVLAGECARAAVVLTGLPADAFALPTRCPPWDVKALAGHLYRDVDRILQYRDLPAGPADTDAVSYWRSYAPADDAPAISARAVEVADGYASGTELAVAFDARWREAVGAARAMSPGRAFATSFGPTLRLDEYVRTRVLELAVHGLDLADALGRAPWITEPASAEVRRILIGLLGAEPPAALGWDAIAFIEAGTGRRALHATDRRLLGDRADRFPLLA